MGLIATYRDWNATAQRQYCRLTRQTNPAQFLIKPRTGLVFVLEEVMFSARKDGNAAVAIANLQLVVVDANGVPGTADAVGTVNAAGTTTTNIVSNELLVNLAHVGKQLQLTSGAISGQMRPITTNSTTAFTTTAFTAIPAGGVGYRVLNQGNVVPLLPMWRQRQNNTGGVFVSYIKHKKNLELVLGRGAGIGVFTLMGTIGGNTYVEWDEYSIFVRGRWEAEGYRSTTPNFQFQPSGGL